ncbi:MAG: cell division protein FtsA [Patescibacteria group bacterium]|nr:cell division protein FtsA [Patescibacteria group bacterium]MCL5431738.1 cell division protein FtsA [Patescibacteria group bacterium]
MARDKIITAIDVGSSKVTTVIASNLKEDKLSVIGVSTIPSKGLRKGQIVDIEESVAAISQSVEAAERMAGLSVGSAYVSIGGAHITSQNSKGVVAVANPEGEITSEDVHRVVEAARAVSLPSSREILHVLPRDFVVDGQAGIKDPLGMTGVRLEVDTQIVTGSTTAIRNLAKCVGEVGVDIESLVFSGLAASTAVLSDTEKELGVILVDIGAGTTDVAIWVDGALSYSAVLPVGARNVTNDIAVGLRVSLESAEKIKLLLSEKPRPMEAVKAADEVDLSGLGLTEDVKKISRKTLTEGIIKPRLLEIFTFVGMEIQKSGFGGMTPSGVVVTGGGAETVGILEACRTRLVMPCRVGSPFAVGTNEEIRLTGLTDELNSPMFSSAVGLILYNTLGLEETKLDSGPKISLPKVSLPKLPAFGKMTQITKLLKSFLP